MKSYAVLALILCLSGGCDRSEPPPDIIKPQRDAMDKAKAVDPMLQQSADQRREELERQESR